MEEKQVSIADVLTRVEELDEHLDSLLIGVQAEIRALRAVLAEMTSRLREQG